MLDSAELLRPRSRFASEERCSDDAGGGEPDRRRAVEVGGRCDTQSWTSSETCGFETRLSVFLDDGLVVMMMVGEGEKGVLGR